MALVLVVVVGMGMASGGGKGVDKGGVLGLELVQFR